VLCATAPALAAPSISGVAGTSAAGQTVTITGSGFGNKPQAQPVLWDDFEGGAIGKQIQDVAAAVGHWDTGSGSANVTYTNVKSHGGKMASRHNFMDFYDASLSKNMPFTRLYMDFWMLAHYVDRHSRNFKPWRFYGDNDNYQLDYVWLCNSNLMNRVQANANLETGTWGGPLYSKDRWMHFQVVYNESSPGQANGTVRHYIDSQVAGLDSGAVLTEKVSARFDQIRIGHYWDKAPDTSCPANGGAFVYVDDVYIDTSWARVELGDAPTYAAATHREIQVASAWADGSVSVTFMSANGISIWHGAVVGRIGVNTTIVLNSFGQTIARRLHDDWFVRIAELEPGRITGLDIHQLVNNGLFSFDALFFAEFSGITQEG